MGKRGAVRTPQHIGWLTMLIVGLTAVGHAATRSDVADAVMKGDKAAFRALLQKKIDVNAPQVDGATALHWAVYRDDAEMVNQLIRGGANVNVTNREGVTPLAMASLYGWPAIIEALLRAGADAKQRTANGETLVMFAARNGNPAAIKPLVAAGADVNAKEKLRGTTALMWAVEQKHPAAVKTLVELGADVGARSGPAGLPRNYLAPRVRTDAVEGAARRHAAAAAAGRTYQEQLEWEAAHGVTISLGFRGTLNAGGNRGEADTPPRRGAPGQRNSGQTTTQEAAPAPAPDAAPLSADDADDSDVIVAGLVGTGGGGLTPLIFAAREGDLESAKYLLDGGADVNQTSEYRWTPLLTATNNRHYKLAAYLIGRGADVNIANKGGWTPLYLATDNRNIEGGDYPVPKPDMDHLALIRILLDRGADPNTPAKDNTLTRTIFTMQWFHENGATPFVRAGQSSDVELMQLLLDYGADPLIATENGDTALTASAGIGWVEGVTYERSPQDNVDAIRMLLDLGLDPNAANREGRTALIGAALKGRNEVVQLLVDRGAKLETRDGGSRDTDNSVSFLAGHTWQAIDYADGLVRVGVQSAIGRPETAALLRKLMTDRGLPVPPPNRVIESICVVSICQERVGK
jgi:ankyrin repeat protein